MKCRICGKAVSFWETFYFGHTAYFPSHQLCYNKRVFG
jgi:hypothetical protein